MNCFQKILSVRLLLFSLPEFFAVRIRILSIRSSKETEERSSSVEGIYIYIRTRGVSKSGVWEYVTRKVEARFLIFIERID